MLCFYFSSRRRHTTSKRDWSSDVCSSDLIAGNPAGSLHRLNEAEVKLPIASRRIRPGEVSRHRGQSHLLQFSALGERLKRSEERRVGKECSEGGRREHYQKYQAR